MGNEELLNQYTKVRECEYKDRRYLARDNGAICRLTKEGGRLGRRTSNSMGDQLYSGRRYIGQKRCMIERNSKS